MSRIELSKKAAKFAEYNKSNFIYKGSRVNNNNSVKFWFEGGAVRTLNQDDIDALIAVDLAPKWICNKAEQLKGSEG